MENLKHLIGAYFHQDWNHVYPTREAAVADLLRREPKVASQAAEEIDLVLGSETDHELRDTLDALGFDDAPFDGERSFLLAIRDQIRAENALEIRSS